MRVELQPVASANLRYMLGGFPRDTCELWIANQAQQSEAVRFRDFNFRVLLRHFIANQAQQSEAVRFRDFNFRVRLRWFIAPHSGDALRMQTIPPNPESILLQPDIIVLVCRRLQVIDLLRCSMVCRVFCATIDESLSACFQRHLCWKGYFLGKWPVVASDWCLGWPMCFDPERNAFVSSIAIDNPSVRHMWRFNTVPIVSNYVSISLRLSLPVEHVRLDKTDGQVARLLTKKHVSMNVHRWEILHLSAYNSYEHEGLGNMVLKAVLTDMHHDQWTKIYVQQDIIVEFQKVPVVALPRINFRTLCVMKCVRSCMHCFQRNTLWQSVEVKNACHRVLCGLCFHELYVPELKISDTWVFSDTDFTESVSRAHFVYHKPGRHHRLNPGRSVCCVLKQEFAEALGYKTWIDFIGGNHKRSVTSMSHKRNFCFRVRQLAPERLHA